MQILFYYDPISHRGDCLWRRAHPAVDSQMYRGLIHRNVRQDVNVKLLMNGWYASAMREHGIADRDLVTLEEEEILRFFPDPHADINRIWYERSNSSAQLAGVAEAIGSKLGGFQPDVIITWTPAPFLRALFPGALILHKEMGLFQRAPYPATFFLDPLGYYGQSLLKQRIAALKDRLPGAEEVAALELLRQHFISQITEKTPFKAVMAPYRERFRKLLLLPLQYNGYFTFDGICRYRSQMALAEHVLRRTPEDIGVVLTRHTYGNLSDQELDYLRQRYSHAVFIPEAERFQNPSDLLMPFIDGVATITSTTGLKALFWRKALISLGTPYLDWLDDATELGQVGRLLDLPYHPAKDGALAWFLFCYSIPQHFNGRNNWTRGLIGRLLSLYRGGRLEAMFSEPVEPPERLAKELIRVTNRNFPVVDEERTLQDTLRRLTPDQRARLLAPPPGPQQLTPPRGAAGRRVLILYASGRWNASGLYLQDLSRHLVRGGIGCMILAEGDIPAGGEEDGVLWRRFAFDGYLLEGTLKREIIAFAPDVLYVINVRTKPMRTALELHVVLGSRIAVQSEDDDLLIFEKFYRNPDRTLLEILDKPTIGNSEIREFLSRIDWLHTFDIWRGKVNYRDVEPLLRIACYRLADLHTAIWQPMADKLAQAFAKPTLLVPPVIELADFDPAPLTQAERRRTLGRFQIAPDTLVVFLAGTIYDFSEEFETFLRSLALASRHAKITLAIAGRSRVKVAPLVERHLKGEVAFRDLGTPDDADYLAMMRAADVIAAPGVPDQFNRLRLSSRLVKAMAFAKPIFTYRCGFGESLEDGVNAVLTDGTTPKEWAEKLLLLADPERRLAIGRAARHFAEREFDAAPVAERLAGGLFASLDGPEPRKVQAAKLFALPATAVDRRTLAPLPAPALKRSALARKTRKLLRDPRQFLADSRIVVLFRGRCAS